MKDTKENEKQETNKKINFQSLGNIFLLIILVLIIGNAILINSLLNSSENEIENTTAENNITNEAEVDTIANIINEVVSNNTSNTTINTNKIQNEKLIVLFDGLLLDTTKMDLVSPDYIKVDDPEKDKYVITYYNYENFAFKDSSLGKISEEVYEGSARIDGVGKVAISEEYNAIPREVKVVNTLPTIVLENNELSQYDSVKTIVTDLDGNGTNEYIAILANKKTGYSKITLYDNTGKLVASLADFEKSRSLNPDNEWYFSLDEVNVIDIDNDNVMEILIEVPRYEGTSSVSLLKYKNNELTGKTNVECTMLP